MRLVQFIFNGKQCVGIERKDSSVINLTDEHADIPSNIVDFLAGGEKLLRIAKTIDQNDGNSISRDEVKYLPPITGCEKVICVGLNYKDGKPDTQLPTEPVIFNKFPSAIIGNEDCIRIPKCSNFVDWEAELAVVFGKEGKNIKESEALKYVAGYTIANDVSARDWQTKKNSGQCLLGKTFDTFCPLGPALVTKDEITDPNNLSLKCWVNGKLMQNSNTSQMIFNIESCIAWVSKFFTLKPGDLLLTGTPPGAGWKRLPPISLKENDKVVCEIEGLGKLSISVVMED